jgi:hypothetical protein
MTPGAIYQESIVRWLRQLSQSVGKVSRERLRDRGLCLGYEVCTYNI